jgi:autotransporter-associated beta strand protein
LVIFQEGNSIIMQSKSRRKLVFERLESRSLLAVTTTFLPDPYENTAPKIFNRSAMAISGSLLRTPSVVLGQFDVESDPLKLVSYSSPSHGWVISNGDGTLNYTSDDGYVGWDSFQFTIGDGRGGLSTGTMTIEVVAPGKTAGTSSFTGFAKMQAGGIDVDLGQFSKVSPRAIDFDADGRIDILAGANGKILLYRNIGTAYEPVFASGVPLKAAGTNISIGNGRLAISTVDIDSDGRFDLVATGSNDFRTRWYRNVGTATNPIFNSAILFKQQDGLSDHVAANVRVEVADWNGDGLADIIAGSFDRFFQVAYNVGTPMSPRFAAPTNVIDSRGLTIQGAYNLNPRVFDLNGDGRPDFIDSYNWGDINFRINQGTSKLPDLPESSKLLITDKNGVRLNLQQITDGPIVDFQDFNGDGILDLVSGGELSGTIYLAYGQHGLDYLSEIETLVAEHPEDLGPFLNSPTNAADQARLKHILEGLYDAVVYWVMPWQKEIILERLLHLIDSNPKYFKLQTLDLTSQPGIPSLAAQLWLTALMTNYYDPYTRKAICDAAGFPQPDEPGGAYRKLVQDLGLFLMDNYQSPSGAEAIYQNVRNIPRNVYPGTGLTMNDWLGAPNYLVRGSLKNNFNGYPDQGYPEFGFGDDAAAVIGGRGSENQYMTVIHHEIMHDMDAFVSRSPDLYRRWGQMLVRAAGRDKNGTSFIIADPQTGWFSVPLTQEHWRNQGWWNGTDSWPSTYDAFFNSGLGKDWNKLGFMRGDIAWFLYNPQESLATQGNQYWNSGEGRLQVAINRWYQGYDTNITEVLFFMDVLSLGLSKIQLCENDEYSNQVISFAKLSRNQWGFIDGVFVNGREYRFSVDNKGNVTQVLSPLAPDVSMPAIAMPSIVTTASTRLSVSATSTNGSDPSSLIYHWTATDLPQGATMPRFGTNGSNAAKETVVEFDSAGTYLLTATIVDKYATGFPFKTSSTTVTVVPTASGISISPENTVVNPGDRIQFRAYQSDQFGNPLTTPTNVQWSVISAQGTIDASGLYTAPADPIIATIVATQGSEAAYSTVRTGSVSSWSQRSGGSWTASANWASGIAPEQSDVVADFSRVNLTQDAVVTLDGDRIAGGLLFGDQDPGQNWILETGTGGILTLDTSIGQPTIFVSNGEATISGRLASGDGLRKTGQGILKQNANFDIVGGITIDEGIYEVSAGGWSSNPFTQSNQILVNRDGTLRTTGSQSLGVANNRVWINDGTLQLGADNYFYDFRMTGGRVIGGQLQLLGGTIPIDPSEETARIESDVRFIYETTLDVGDGSPDVDLVLAGVMLNPFSITKTGQGTLLVSSPAVYTGGTIVQQGAMFFDDGGGAGAATGTMSVSDGATVGGIGMIASQLTVNPGAKLIPKPNGIGQLKLGKSLFLAGTSLFEIDPSNKKFDQIVAGSNIDLGGSLIVNSLGGTFDANDRFQLFSAPTFAGSFASVTLPELDSGLLWDLSKLSSSGLIQVVEVNAPVGISLSPRFVKENLIPATPVGTLSTNDPEPNDTFVYSLVRGPGDLDNGSFTIVESQLRAIQSFDYEPKSKYSVRVRSTDRLGLYTEEVFSIGIEDVNEAPVANDDKFWMLIGSTKLLDILGNDIDSEGTIDPSKVVIVSPPSHGFVQVQTDGLIQLKADPSFIGEISFRYAVRDSMDSESNPATVRVTVVGSTHQNPTNRYDVNNDRSTSPLDVLLIINLLNFKGASLPVEGLPGPPNYVDVNGDKRVDPLDILELINFINKGSLQSGEGLEVFEDSVMEEAFYSSLEFESPNGTTRKRRSYGPKKLTWPL